MTGTELFKEYVRRGVRVTKARQCAKVLYEKAPEGLVVEAYNGNGALESREVAGKDQWLLTKLDSDGEASLNPDGRKVQWLIDDAVFKESYEYDADKPFGVAVSKGAVKQVVMLSEAVTIETSFGEQHLSAADMLL